MYLGEYKSPEHGRTARLERNGNVMIVHYPEAGITRHAIPVGDHLFKRLDFKQTFRFTLVNGQVTQFTRKFTLNDNQTMYDKIE